MIKTICGSATERLRNGGPGIQGARSVSRSAVPVMRTLTRTTHTAAAVIHNVTTAHESDLFRLTRECILKLRTIPFDANLVKNVYTLGRTYSDALKAGANDDYLNMNVNAINSSARALTMAIAWDLGMLLEWIPNFFQDYNLKNGPMPLEKAIAPKHLKFLTDSFRETFHKLPEQDRKKLVIAIDTEAMNRFDCDLTPEERRLQFSARLWWDRLRFDEVIAMVDYCHVDTSQFVPVNSALRLSSYAGTTITSKIVSCVSEPMIRGLRKLMANEDFIHRGNLFKGVYTLDAAGPFRKSQLISGNTWVVPHATSATSDPDQSYANPPTYPVLAEPRDTNLVFVDVWGVQVHLFNHWSTVHQKEVLIMPTMAFHGISAPAELARDMKPGRKPSYYCALDPEHSGYTL